MDGWIDGWRVRRWRASADAGEGDARVESSSSSKNHQKGTERARV
jgi:hypothetical protein